ncbi:protein phosphatase 1 regulatory subunit 1B isoform X2 [Phycodurus eques]|uniref:protein phosphatase 1 regulatory subunit 1B isoform X2 n=1 Tax=Phycodurus eques TaxID=693459 RepID=UPI002ACEE35D|nr:protein phosphatase 1 regulatory subunit 1B isoform X2 [Phycodurus eques]
MTQEQGAMEPSVSTEVEPKERRKIQFAVPASAATNLDPRQVEMIRRRRPTPATLFRVADQASPEDDQSSHQWVVGENGVLKPKRVNPNVYQPPSLKAVQKMAEAHMQNFGVRPPLEDPHEGEEDDDLEKAADHQEMGTSDPSEVAPGAQETDKLIQALHVEEEEEEEEGEVGEGREGRGTTEENKSLGSN